MGGGRIFPKTRRDVFFNKALSNEEINVLKIIKKDETKKVRTYGRKVYINFDPKWIKKPLRMTEYIMSVTTNS
jgi:hypothetical protein